MSRYAATSKFWWKGLTLDADQTARWEIGPLVLQVCRLEQEWQVAYARVDTAADDTHDWQFAVVNEPLGAEADLKRYLFKTAVYIPGIWRFRLEYAVFGLGQAGKLPGAEEHDLRGNQGGL